MMTETPRRTAIELKDFGLSVAGRSLLEDTGFRIKEGEFVLLVGASGTGKSLTLSLLAGLLEGRLGFGVTGHLKIFGKERRDPRKPEKGERLGVVFQDFALFDEFTAIENVRFAREHGALRGEGAALERALLEELGLPQDQKPHRLSGGMKQRLALARTLAYGPKICLYDEPTSGLDPALSRRVATLLRATHDRHQSTTLIITHDVQAWVGIADRALLLDPEAKSLRALPLEEAASALNAIRPLPEAQSAKPSQSLLSRIESGLTRIGDFIIDALQTLLALIPRPPRAAYALRYFLYYLRLTTLGSALPFMAMAGFIGGFIATYFLFGLLPFRGYTEPVLAEEFIGSLGFANWRVLTPSLVALLFAARSGAALSADFGHRRLSRQCDALTSFGVPPERYLLTPALLASVVGIPILFFVADMSSRLAALGVYLAQHPGHGGLAFTAEFHRLLGGPGGIPDGLGWVMGKLLITALGTASIAWHIGNSEKESGAAVAQGVTSTIIRATLFALLTMLAFAPFEFRNDLP